MRAGPAAATAGAGGATATAALALLPLCEAGIPVGVPADLLMFVVGERVAAGAMPVWLAVAGLQVAAVAGTAALFLAVRGPARARVLRVGSRLGITEARLGRATGLIARRGPPAVAAGRATPGLRTLTAVAAALSTLPPRRALAALVAGSTVFVQGHFVLGYAAGSAARETLEAARGPAVALLAATALAGLVLSIRRRGRRRGVQAWAEASCPVCVVVAAVDRR